MLRLKSSMSFAPRTTSNDQGVMLEKRITGSLGHRWPNVVGKYLDVSPGIHSCHELPQSSEISIHAFLSP